MTTAAAASAQRLWYQGARSTTLAVIRDRTAGTRFGVAGHAICAASVFSCRSRSATRHLPERRPQARERSGEARFDSAFWNAQRRRGLLAAELEQVPRGDHQRGFLSERVDLVQQTAHVLRSA